MEWLCTALMGRAAETSGVVGVVITGEGTLAMKSNGLPERPALSDLWRELERFDEGARDPGVA